MGESAARNYRKGETVKLINANRTCGYGKASLRDVSGSARRADGSRRSNHADFPITPKISFRSSKLVFKKPCLEFGVR